MKDSYETLLLSEPQEYTLLVTLNRPKSGNAMNTQMGHDLLDVFDSVNASPPKPLLRCALSRFPAHGLQCCVTDAQRRAQSAATSAPTLCRFRSAPPTSPCPHSTSARPAAHNGARAEVCETSVYHTRRLYTRRGWENNNREDYSYNGH